MDTVTEAASRPTILAVDDSPENLWLISGLLKSRYRIRMVNSGEAGLEAAGTEPLPDLILMDVMMPRL